MTLVALTLLGVAWHIASGPSVQTGRAPFLPHTWFAAEGPPAGGKTAAFFEGDSRVLHTEANGLVLLPEHVALARELNEPQTGVERDFEILELLIQAFRKANLGGGPSGGENEEIIAQLSGGNAKHLAVIAPDHAAINERGQLLDRWGTPYYFHPVSREQLDIRSAGPDKLLFTKDDVTIPGDS